MRPMSGAIFVVFRGKTKVGDAFADSLTQKKEMCYASVL